MEYVSDTLTTIWRQMSKATSMADCEAELFDIMDVMILSEKIEEEFKRLVATKQ